jgi:hemerythrin
MSDGNKATFNIRELYKLKDLNIRQFANENPHETVGEYFDLLSEFVEVAPNVLKALKKGLDLDDTGPEWHYVEKIIDIFQQLCCDKYLPDLFSINIARKQRERKMAAHHVKAIFDDFNSLYETVISAKIQESDDVDGDAPDVSVFLKDCLKDFDEEEANRRMLVLTVDDSLDILTAVAAVLSSEYKVFKLPKPEMLQTVLQQVTPDLFLLDYQMPELSGFDLVPIIRSFPEHSETPIIFLTSEGTINHVSAAMALGACDFMVKPFQREILLEKVAKHIKKRNLYNTDARNVAYAWSKDLEIGNPDIDMQHKQLVMMFNELMAACNSGKGAAELEKSLNFLVSYTVRHFNDEEEWQRKVNYPRRKEHMALHNSFKATVTDLVDKFKKEGPTTEIVFMLNSAVGMWLVNHIKNEDAKIGEHIKTK